MDLQKMTQKFQEIIQNAQNLAIMNNNQEIDLFHIMSCLLKSNDTKVHEILKQSGIDNINDLLLKLDQFIKELPSVHNPSTLQFSRDTYKTLLQTQEISKQRGDDFVRPEIFIPAALSFENKLKQLLFQFGIKEHKLKNSIASLLQEKAQTQTFEESNDLLAKYTIDFTEKATQNKLDPVIGRDEEIRRTMQILARRTKNNPVLIGNPGVGKTAVVEGLAQRIIAGEVPESLKGKKLLGLDLVGMVAGTRMRGDFEERLQGVIKAVQKQAGTIILFIDEIHNLVGAGKGEGAMDASNILKPALARGELHCIGATTLDEHKKFIEKDSALDRRFQKVMVNEPSVTDTIAILRGLKEKYEIHHGVTINDEALVAAAKLSNRYITDRFLPDKAIDLVDEAAAFIKLEIDSKPESIDKIERRIIQLNVEKAVLEKDPDSENLLKPIIQELEQLNKEKNRLMQIWEKQKAESFSVQELKNNIEKTKDQIKNLKKDAKWEEVGKLEYEVLPKLQKLLDEKSKNNATKPEEHEEKLFRKTVTAEEIASIISKSTGIEVDKMMQPQKQKLLKMEDFLHKSIIGQDVAVTSVSKTIRRARAGLSDENRPYGSFLFLGPTGVGKTELVKSLAKFLFDSEKNIVRIDMSELMEKHSVARLIGAPPGYVGYEEGGMLTEAVRRKPYSIVLLDEIEKAHPDVFNVLLQVLDDGRLTDGQGNVVDFKNTVIIMTSNIGSSKIQEELLDQQRSIGFHTNTKNNKTDIDLKQDYNRIKTTVMKEVKNHFKPEFLNRIDDIVIFHPLSTEQITKIVLLQLSKLDAKLKSKNIFITFDNSVVEHIVKIGFDPIFGARPIKRAIQNDIETFISDKLLEDEIIENSNYLLTYDENKGLTIINECK